VEVFLPSKLPGRVVAGVLNPVKPVVDESGVTPWGVVVCILCVVMALAAAHTIRFNTAMVLVAE